jgi:hypothetical protein
MPGGKVVAVGEEIAETTAENSDLITRLFKAGSRLSLKFLDRLKSISKLGDTTEALNKQLIESKALNDALKQQKSLLEDIKSLHIENKDELVKNNKIAKELAESADPSILKVTKNFTKENWGKGLVAIFGIAVIGCALDIFNRNNNKPIEIISMTAYNGGSTPPIAWESPSASIEPYVPGPGELDLPQETDPASPTGAEPKATSNTVLITFKPKKKISNGDSITIKNNVNTIPSYAGQTFSIDQIINNHQFVVTFNNPPIQNYATSGTLILRTTFTNCLNQSSFDVGKGAGTAVVEGGKVITEVGKGVGATAGTVAAGTTSGVLSSLGFSGFSAGTLTYICVPLCFCIIFIFIIRYIMKKK